MRIVNSNIAVCHAWPVYYTCFPLFVSYFFKVLFIHNYTPPRLKIYIVFIKNMYVLKYCYFRSLRQINYFLVLLLTAIAFENSGYLNYDK